MKILFQGDSITDAGRNGETGLGSGYVHYTFEKLGRTFKKAEFINRGISGNRVKDLEARWTEDCIQHQPDILTILIGINDTWRFFDSGEKTTAEEFYAAYKRILERVKNESPHTKIILIEPFLLPIPQDRLAWREDLDPKIQKVRELAYEFKTGFLPLDGLVAEASIKYGYEQLAQDGVHPDLALQQVIAEYLALFIKRIAK